MLNNFVSKKTFYFYFFLILYFFHLTIAFIFYYIAKSNFLLEFHNGNGIWNFYPDVLSYHVQAIRVSEYILGGKIGLVEFFTNTIPDIYNNNRNIKWMALLYLISGFKEPVIYSILNSFLWSICIIYTFKLSKIIFQNNLISFFSIAYFFFPTIILTFTQPLRDPFYYTYFVFFSYAITRYFTNNRINIGFDKKIKTFIKLGKKLNVNVFFIFDKKKYIKNFESIFFLILAIIFLYSSRDYIVPILIVFLYLFYFLYFVFFSIKISYKINILEINICLINIITILTVFLFIFCITNLLGTKKGLQYFVKLQQVNEIALTELSVVENTLIDSNNLDIDKKNQQSKHAINQQSKNSINKQPKNALNQQSQNSININKENQLPNLNLGSNTTPECPEEVDYKTKRHPSEVIFVVDFCEKKSLKLIFTKLINDIKKSFQYRYSKLFIYKNVLVNQTLLTIQTLRNGFTTMYGDDPASSLDVEIIFNDLRDIFNYIDSAIVIGFFLPIPIKVIFDFNTLSPVYIIGGIEMVFMYLIYFGFIIAIYKNIKKIYPLLPILIFSIGFILLLSYIVPYLGTLYRMRSPFYLVFFIIGISTYVDLFFNKSK